MKEQCKYGSSCYRKRPEHFIDFDHPPDHQIANMFAKKRKIKNSTDSNEEPKLKIPRPDISNISPSILSNPFGLFVTKIPGVTSCDFPQDGFNFIFWSTWVCWQSESSNWLRKSPWSIQSFQFKNSFFDPIEDGSKFKFDIFWSGSSWDSTVESFVL